MRQVLIRRFKRFLKADPGFDILPDVLLIDGGIAHAKIAVDVLTEVQLKVPVFGMVKDDFHKTRALTDGENEISIAFEMNVYTFIYNLQEEAHRFAVKNSQKAKIKTMTHSSLEKIDGIGPAKAKALLSTMTLSEIRHADKARLTKVKGISERDAENIESYFLKIRNK
jgi:excinuclease ABC subunit C